MIATFILIFMRTRDDFEAEIFRFCEVEFRLDILDAIQAGWFTIKRPIETSLVEKNDLH